MDNEHHKHWLFVLACLLGCFLSSAQSNTQALNHKLSEKTVVKDSARNRYAFQHWQQLVMSGEFTIVPVHPNREATEFYIKRLSAEEKEKRFSAMPKPVESESFKTGAKLIPFSENSIQSERLRLKKMGGKIVVLNFWFIDCPPCRVEIPQLNELVKSFQDDSTVIFIAIGLDSRNRIEDFLKTVPFNYKIVDGGKSLADRYGIRTYPTHVIIDGEGMVKFHTSGLALNTIYWLKKTIDEAISQRNLLKKTK